MIEVTAGREYKIALKRKPMKATTAITEQDKILGWWMQDQGGKLHAIRNGDIKGEVNSDALR